MYFCFVFLFLSWWCSALSCTDVGVACIDQATGYVTALGGPTEFGKSVHHDISYMTHLYGCIVISLSSELTRTGGVAVKRRFQCNDSKYIRGGPRTAEVVDTWTPRAGEGTLWETTISSHDPVHWTTRIDTVYNVSREEDLTIWTGAFNGVRLDATHSSLTPTPLRSFSHAERAVPYSGTTVLIPNRRSKLQTQVDAGTTALPILVLINSVEGYAFSAVQDPANHPPEAWLDRSSGPLAWQREWFRLGNGTVPVTLRQHLLWHEADWRPALDFLVNRGAPSFFAPDPRANVSDVDGGGAYADYRGEGDTKSIIGDDGVEIAGPSALGTYRNTLDAMGFKVNWDSGEQFPAHGQWVPYNLSTLQPYEGEWETCFAHQNFTALDAHVPHSEEGDAYMSVCWKLNYEMMNSYYSDLRSMGFASLTYGNYWEYGFNTQRTDTALKCDATDPKRWSNGPRIAKSSDLGLRVRSMCDSNLFLREHLSESPFRTWSGGNVDHSSVILSGMMGSANMDAGHPQYRQHLLRMVDLLITRLPASAGIAFDGTGWGAYVNTLADDGRSFVELYSEEVGGKTIVPPTVCRAQVSSYLNITQAIGERLHSAGKIHAHNTYQPRLDFWEHIDVVFSENGFTDGFMHSNSMLGLGGKPVIAWNPGCGRDPAFQQCPPMDNWDWPTYKDTTPETAQAALRRMLMRLLYWGNQPTLPFPRNDHTITPWIAKQQGLFEIYKSFAPLFKAIRHRRWVLAAHACEIITGVAQINLFHIINSSSFVAPVVFAPSVGRVEVALRGMDLACKDIPGKLDVTLLQPTDTPSSSSARLAAAPVWLEGSLRLSISFGSGMSEDSEHSNAVLVLLRCSTNLSLPTGIENLFI